MSEPTKINRTPIQWVPELPADAPIDWSNLRVVAYHPLGCLCPDCQRREAVRVGSAENPVVTMPEPRPL